MQKYRTETHLRHAASAICSADGPGQHDSATA